MALTMSITEKKIYYYRDALCDDSIERDETYPHSYIKIDSVSGSKQALDLSVQFFTEKNGKFFKEKMYEFVPTMTDKNFIAQGYEYLKTLPEFAGAEDC